MAKEHKVISAVLGSGGRIEAFSVSILSCAPCHLVFPSEFAFFFPKFLKFLLPQCLLSSHLVYEFFFVP